MYERQVKALGDKMYSIEVRINNVERSDKMKVDTQRVGVSVKTHCLLRAAASLMQDEDKGTEGGR